MMMDTSSNASLVTSDDSVNMFMCSLAEVDQDLSYFRDLENEITGLQHSVVEPDPEYNRDSLGDIDFGTFTSPMGFNIGSISCNFEYDQIKFDNGALDWCLTQEEEETNGKKDGKLPGSNEKVLKNLSLQPTCEKTILDAEQAYEISSSNCGACEDSSMGYFALESHSQHLQERDCVGEISDLSSATVMWLQSTYDKNLLLLDRMTVQELQEVFSRMFGHETPVVDTQWLKYCILFGLKNHDELVNFLSLSECGKTCDVNEGNTVQSSTPALPGRPLESLTAVLGDQYMSGDEHVNGDEVPGCDSLERYFSSVGVGGLSFSDKINTEGAIPQKGCIEGRPEQESRNIYRKPGAFHKNSWSSILHVTSDKQHCQKRCGTVQLVRQEKFSKKVCVQVPNGLPVQIGQSKRNSSSSDYDLEDWRDNKVSLSYEDFDAESSSAESQGETGKNDCVRRSNDRRHKSWKKQNKRWTLSEVMKLIQGVSQYGVGKWNEIKKQLFSSSSHRTSVHIKDKWRNLVKKCCHQAQTKEKVGNRQMQTSLQLPESVKCQIRELAVMHSHTRERTSNI